MSSIFLDTLSGIKTSRPPIWFMRQAGRILPSYQKLKLSHSFDDLMKNKELASKVTLMPINDLGVDAAILFSDILIIPESIGMNLEFTDNGPKFHNPIVDDKVNDLLFDPSKLNHVYSNIKEIKKNDKKTPLIGFCGGPLTTFLFMFRGNEKDKSFNNALKFFYSNKKESIKILDKLTEASIQYVEGQIDAGIDCFQLFETYCGIIPSDLYKEIVLPLSVKILDVARDKNIPTIFFPKNFNDGLKYINSDICDFVSIDWNLSLEYAREVVDSSVGIQGNMNPRLFYSSYEEIDMYLNGLLNFGEKNYDWIFNLGHGFLPDIDHLKVKHVVKWIKEANWNRK